MRFQLVTTINLEYQVLHVYVVQGWKKVLTSLILEEVFEGVGVDTTFQGHSWCIVEFGGVTQINLGEKMICVGANDVVVFQGKHKGCFQYN